MATALSPGSSTVRIELWAASLPERIIGWVPVDQGKKGRTRTLEEPRDLR